MKKYTTLLIGAGQIGALKDDKFDSITTENILTHAHAIKIHKQLGDLTIVESNHEKLFQSSTKWKCNGFMNLDDLKGLFFDIVTIATPTQTHMDIIKEVQKKINYKAIILEKPACMDSIECNKINDKDRIAINYLRRYETQFHGLKLKFEQQNTKIFSCNVKYNRGLLRDGCHALDFFRLSYIQRHSDQDKNN